MAKLEKLSIKGYKSIKDASIEINSLNVLIGANGAGKSNFVSFFKMLNEISRNHLQEYIAKQGGANSVLHFGLKYTNRIQCEFEFANDDLKIHYSFDLIHTPPEHLNFVSEKIAQINNGRFELGLLTSLTHRVNRETSLNDPLNCDNELVKILNQLLHRCKHFHFHDTTPESKIRQSCYLNDNHYLQHDAGNIASILYLLKQRYILNYERIVAFISNIIPDFDDFELEPLMLNPNYIQLNWRKKGQDYLFGPHQLSDGSLRTIGLATLFHLPKEFAPELVVLDEPELGLHPTALELIVGLIKSYSIKRQVILATQSAELLSMFQPEDVIVVESFNSASSFRRLSTPELEHWLEGYTLGELWQRNVIGGGPIP